MIDPMQAILNPTIPPTSAFAPGSRYSGIDTATLETAAGTTVIYLRRRFVPPPSDEASQEHLVAQDERLDRISARYLGDPLLFWRICDANAAMRPDALTETIGRRLRIPQPAGIAGPAV